jgi:hypothetical protein
MSKQVAEPPNNDRHKDPTDDRGWSALGFSAQRGAAAHGQVVQRDGQPPLVRPTSSATAKLRAETAAPQHKPTGNRAQRAPAGQKQTSSAARQAELRQLCARLRATHRCPGRCVFTGELRRPARHL